MQDAYTYCEDLVRTADKDRYLASLFLPAPVRPHAFALYAFNAQIASVRERAREPMAGEVRLQWWRDALAGNAAGGTAGNPVATAFLETIDRFHLPRSDFERLLEARSFDLYDDPMPTMAAFEGYLHATTSVWFETVGRMLDGEERPLGETARYAGLAYGLTGLLRAFPLHASRGQVYIPRDRLERAGARQEDILAGQTTPAITQLLTELRAETRRHWSEAQKRLTSVPAAARPAFLPLAVVDAYLARMERPDYDPFKTPVEVPQWRRQWALWRSARRLLR